MYRRQQRQTLYCTAVNMKLLMDMPEMVTNLFHNSVLLLLFTVI